MTPPRRLLAVSFAVALLAVAGCSSDDSGGSDDKDADAPVTSASTGTDPESESPEPDPDAPLGFDVVEAATADLASPECAQPYWGENPTGAEGQVDFRQLDCWAKDADPESLLAGFPELLQTVTWAEFATADEAKAYAADQLDDRTVLVAGPTAMVASPFPWKDDAAALVAEVQAACGCGVIGG